jgi:hypothetical protein
MKADKYQTRLIKAYPSVELLGIDLDDPAAIEEAVHSKDGTGDSLFDFLWIELKDVTDDVEALRRIDIAIGDLHVVRSAITD